MCYIQIIFTFVAELGIFGKSINLLGIIGAVLIVAGSISVTLYKIWLEKKESKNKEKENLDNQLNTEKSP